MDKEHYALVRKIITDNVGEEWPRAVEAANTGATPAMLAKILGISLQAAIEREHVDANWAATWNMLLTRSAAYWDIVRANMLGRSISVGKPDAAVAREFRGGVEAYMGEAYRLTKRRKQTLQSDMDAAKAADRIMLTSVGMPRDMIDQLMGLGDPVNGAR